MDELVNLVSEKASISDSQAAMAVKTVMDFLNDKHPHLSVIKSRMLWKVIHLPML